MNLDFIFFIIIGAFVLIYGYSMGMGRLALLTISSYLAYIVTISFPYDLIGISSDSIYLVKLAVFAALCAFLYLMLPKSLLQSYVKIKSGSKGKVWKIVIFSILQLGLFWAMIISFLPNEILTNWSSFSVTYFSGYYYFGWIFLPLLVWVLWRGRD